jgi:phosphohistidine phosphatase SixA
MSDCSDAPNSVAASSAGGSKKSIVFIRHAQSEENVKAIRFFDGLSRLRNFQAPSMQQISSTLSLASLTVNAPLSQLGKRQILDMHMILKDKEFWVQQKFDLIVCSPLTRAKETCEGLLPRERDGVNTMIIDDLEEATPYEHVFSGTLLKRINSFKHWLANREEKRILVVGHSQYFKKLLGQSSLMRNCDVWQCDFDFDRGNGTTDKLTFEWTNLNLLHRTELSDAHPYDKLVNPKSLNQEITKTKERDEVHNDLNDDEPTCRICQVSSTYIFSRQATLCMLFESVHVVKILIQCCIH